MLKKMKALTKITLGIFLLFSIFCSPLSVANVAVPHLINYQGRLTDSSGNPLNGTYNLTFRLYNAETGSGTMVPWEETHSGVSIQKGIFNILLGSITALSLPFDQQYYLEIVVNGEIMTPRQKIASSGYAIRAERAESAEQANNANAVNNIGVSPIPAANKLLPLDNNAKLPISALKVYDSGWFAVTINSSYTKIHNLGTTKVMIQVLFSPNSDGSSFCAITGDNTFNEYDNHMRGTAMTSLTATSVTLRTATAIIDGADASGAIYVPSSGYIRIIMLALE